MRLAAAAAYNFLQSLQRRQLVFPLVLVSLNLASAYKYFAAGDWKHGVYYIASAICLLMASL